jgi:hypothetical protein
MHADVSPALEMHVHATLTSVESLDDAVYAEMAEYQVAVKQLRQYCIIISHVFCSGGHSVGLWTFMAALLWAECHKIECIP